MSQSKMLNKKAYNDIYNLIINDRIEFDGIFTLGQFEKILGINRAPIRDALIELCNEGVFESLPRYGYRLVKLENNALTEMLNFRLVLECGFLDKNWERISKLDSSEYDFLLRKSNIVYPDTISEWEYNMSFHVGLFRLHENIHAKTVLEDTMKKMLRFFVQNYRHYWKDWKSFSKEFFNSHHDNVIHHIKNNNRLEAIEELSKDIGEFKRF